MFTVSLQIIVKMYENYFLVLYSSRTILNIADTSSHTPGRCHQRHVVPTLHTTYHPHEYQVSIGRPLNSWENDDKSFMCISVLHWRDGRKIRKNNAHINLSILVFFPTIHLATLKVYTEFEDFGSHRSWEICDRKFNWRQRNMDK